MILILVVSVAGGLFGYGVRTLPDLVWLYLHACYAVTSPMPSPEPFTTSAVFIPSWESTRRPWNSESYSEDFCCTAVHYFSPLSWMQRVPLLKSSEESAWLFHEIARAKWELCEYTEALEYGNKSLDAARDAGDQSWQLCASMLVAQAEGEHTHTSKYLSLSLSHTLLVYSTVKLDNISQAIQSFKCSLDLAKLLDDKMSEEAIKKALEDCNSRIVDSLQRQQQPSEDEAGNESKDTEEEGKKEDT